MTETHIGGRRAKPRAHADARHLYCIGAGCAISRNCSRFLGHYDVKPTDHLNLVRVRHCIEHGQKHFAGFGAAGGAA